MFEKNLSLITKRFPHLLPLLLAEPTEDGLAVETCQSKTGLPVPRLIRTEQKVYLNSSYDPELEAERWASGFAEETRRCLIIFGGGFLYHLRAVLKLKQFSKVICYEPNPTILRSCLETIDLEEFINDDWLLIAGAFNAETLDLSFKYLSYRTVDLRVAEIPSYSLAFPDEKAIFGKELKDKIRIYHVNMATSNATGERWILNAVENLKHVVKSPGVRHLFNQFQGVPGIIISGGPSLEKNIHLLKGLKEKAVIICAGSSIRAALKKGITPHFLVNIDGNPLNSQLYNEYDLKDVNLLYNVRSYPEMIDKYAGRKIHMKMDVEQFSDMISFKSGGYEFGLIRSGFSCAHSALDFAFKIGCNPIIFIGQDLAYTDNKRYADGQISQVQKYVQEQLPPGGLVVKDIDGNDVITDYEFQNFKMWFETIVEKFYKDQTKLINCTEGGQPITGVENRKLADVIEKYCREYRGVSWKIRKNYEKGEREWRKHAGQSFCIPSQIEFLMKEAVNKIDELIDRLQELRKLNFTRNENEREQFETSLKQILSEYEAVLNYREYEVLLVDFKAAKYSAMIFKLYELGSKAIDKEKFDTKLIYAMNILAETKNYLTKIRECNQKSLELGEITHGERFRATGN